MSASYWPIRWLKSLARLPHKYKTWLWWGHSIPNGDPAMPLAPGCPFSGFVIFQPMTVPPEFGELRVSPEKTIHFLSPYPVFPEEMNIKLAEGAEALLERLGKENVTELVDVKRRNTGIARNWWRFGR